MIRMDVKKLVDSLSQIEDRGNQDDNPIFGYLHNLIVLSITRDSAPSFTEVNFEVFTLSDLEEYYKIAVEVMDDIFPKLEQLIKNISSIKALKASKLSFL